MIHRIMITDLFDDASQASISYYCAKDFNEKTLYCDAVMPAEANCKYVLSFYPIDEIIVFGMDGSCQPREEEPIVLRHMDRMVPSDFERASTFSILQYRLMQFFYDVCAEDADQNSVLSEEEQKRTIAFLRRFFNERINIEGERHFNRYFHYLIQDSDLRDEFADAMKTWIPVPETDQERYQKWILHYLYRGLKATSKLEPLEQNESVRMRYINVVESDILSFLNQLMSVFRGLEYDDDVPDTTELYICLHNDHGSDMFALMNAMNLTKVLQKVQVRISRVITQTQLNRLPVHVMCDKTEEYNISELLSATGAFLTYGKTDLLLDYWKRANLNNQKIERIIYAMRNIDYGISLCDISDIERGINSLRSVIKNDLPIAGETTIEKYFELVVESIRQDYGSLLELDQISFIELVKWAYRKGFWQQTLTLIESRAPRDFVCRGFFFYSDGEKTRKHAIEVLGQIYYDLKPYEKYKLDDVAHYYIKYYNRNRAPRNGEGDVYQMSYTAARMEELDTNDGSLIRAQTICTDRAALKDLLFAYYHLCDIRNDTNHAREEFSGFYTIMADTDPGERMKVIIQAIDYFIHCYDKVSNLVKGKKANVVTVSSSELADYSQTIRESNRRYRDRSSVTEKTSNTGTQSTGSLTTQSS